MTSANRKSLALSISALALTCSWPALAQDSGISRTPWQMHAGAPPQKLDAIIPGDGGLETRTYEAFGNAAIPAAEDGGWGSAPDADTINFGSQSASRLRDITDIPDTCRRAVDYTYFQTTVNVPPGTNVTEFAITFRDRMDDAARITIFNDDHPQGSVVDGSYVRRTTAEGATSDLSSLVTAGDNRVVITQVDWCPNGNQLQHAGIELNGEAVPAEPVATITTGTATETPDNVSTASRGDVHIATPDGLRYDYQGVGDFILARSGGEALIVARQRSWEGRPAASVNKAVALSVGNDRVEFSVQPMQLLINGNPATLGAQDLPGGGRISVIGPNDYYVHWSGGNYIVRVILRSDSLDIGHWHDGSMTLDGLLGNYNGQPSDDMQIRDGAVLATPPSATDLARFGESWRIDSNNFSSPHPEGNTPNDELVAGARLSAAERDAGAGQCRAGGVTNAVALEDCAYDVAVTGSAQFIESAKDFQEAVEAQPAAAVVPAAAEPAVALETIAALPAGSNVRTLAELEAATAQAQTAQPEPSAPAPAEPAAQASDSIFPIASEFRFERGTRYPSPSRAHYLVFQDDGNLVIYTSGDQPVWALNSLTDRWRENGIAVFQADGNLATYTADNSYVWSARQVVSPPGTTLRLTDAGELQIVGPDGAVLWNGGAN